MSKTGGQQVGNGNEWPQTVAARLGVNIPRPSRVELFEERGRRTIRVVSEGFLGTTYIVDVKEDADGQGIVYVSRLNNEKSEGSGGYRDVNNVRQAKVVAKDILQEVIRMVVEGK